jgi:hypothetical protein
VIELKQISTSPSWESAAAPCSTNWASTSGSPATSSSRT